MTLSTRSKNRFPARQCRSLALALSVNCLVYNFSGTLVHNPFDCRQICLRHFVPLPNLQPTIEAVQRSDCYKLYRLMINKLIDVQFYEDSHLDSVC